MAKILAGMNIEKKKNKIEIDSDNSGSKEVQYLAESSRKSSMEVHSEETPQKTTRTGPKRGGAGSK